jgi:PST family polysaccharide transporter
MALGLLVGAWIARYLGPADYGTLSFAFAWVALFTPLAAMAHDRIVVRELVERPGSAGVVLGSAGALRLLGGVLGCAAAIAGIAILRPGDAVAFTLVAIFALVMVVQPLAVVELWYQARVRTRDAAGAHRWALVAAAIMWR